MYLSLLVYCNVTTETKNLVGIIIIVVTVIWNFFVVMITVECITI